MSNSPQRAKEIFLAAIQGEIPESERGAWIDRACGGDDLLSRRVHELLSAHAVEDSFLAPPVAVAPGIASAPAPSDGTLGDFRIIREIGRGGMGVVHEAEQISLNRRVALKVLPFAAVLDKRQLQRFRTEAMAAARLHHQHIVPVYQVGCERAVHFYAMQYIEGQNVSELLRQIRMGTGEHSEEPVDLGPTVVSATPTAEPAAPASETALLKDLSTDYVRKKGSYHRRIAALGIQAASALDYAHQQGILHRDIKPSNLMLDEDGELWITDFGLARIEGDAGLTMSGDLLGTLRYMSPEQVLGKRVVVDQRTDIYSLGATLYEMLALRPAYVGADRAELLRKISFEDPDPLRKLDPSIPADLETIVLTAMAHDPRQRYETAQDLADDLQRFLDHKPIRAKRPSRVVRLQKWVTRNKPLTAALALVLVASVVAVAAIASALRDRTDSFTTGDSPLPMAVVQGRALPGLVPVPTRVADVGRWQLITNRPRGMIRGAVFSPDETQFALAEANHVRIYEASNSLLRQVLVAHSRPVRSVAWHPDGNRLASCSEDGTVRLWTSDGRPTHLLEGHAGPVYQVAWRPDGTQLASCDAKGRVVLWSADGELIRTLEEGDRHVFGIDWSPDGQLLATVGGNIWPAGPDGDPGDNSLRVWDTDSGALIRKLDSDVKYSGLCVDWRPDGQQLAVGYGNVYRQVHFQGLPPPDAGVRLWNTDGIPGPVIGRQSGSVYAVAWSPDGDRLAFGGRADFVHLWNADDGTVSDLQATNMRDLAAFCWRHDGTRILTTCRQSVYEWDCADQRTMLVDRATVGFTRVKWSPDGRAIYGNGGDPLFLSPRGEPIAAPQPPEDRRPAWWADENQTRRPDGTAAPSLEGNVPPMRQWAWSSRGWLAAASWEDARVRIWDDQGKLVATLTDHRGGVESVSWSPDGDWLASGGGDSVRIWKANGTPVRVLKGHSDEVYGVAWSPDGQWIASGSTDATIRLWKPDGTLERVLDGHQGCVHDLAWSPDSRKLASGGWLDNTLRVWDIASGQTEWQAVRLDERSTVILNRAGQILSRVPEFADSSLLYVVEQPDGSMRVRTVEEFNKLFGARILSMFLADGNVTEAIPALNTLLRLQKRDSDGHWAADPDARAWNDLAGGFLKLGQPDQAIAACNRAIELDPQDAVARMNLGDALKQQEKTDEALQACEQAIDLDPRSVRAWQTYADTLFKLGNSEGGIEACRKALDLDPNNFKGWHDLGFHLLNAEKFSESVAASLKATEINAGIPETWLNLGAALHRQGKTGEAVDACRKATDIDPQKAKAWGHLGISLAEQGRLDDAVEALNRAVKLDPQLGVVWSNLGTVLNRQGNIDEAIDACRRATKVTPEDAESWNSLGILLSLQGRLGEAGDALETAVRLNPGFLAAWDSFGFLLARQGRVEEAVDAYRRTVELAPDLARYRYYRALLLVANGDIEGYRSACGEILDRFADTTDPETAYWTAWTCALGPDAAPGMDRAVGLAELVENSTVTGWAERRARGVLLYRAVRFEESVATLEAELKSWDAEHLPTADSPAYTWYFLAMAHHRLGHATEAARFLQQARQRTREELSGDPQWNRKLTLQILQKEAVELLGVESPESETAPVDATDDDASPLQDSPAESDGASRP